MGNIFISYSQKDQDYAHQLQGDLLKQGFGVWMDDRIDGGAPWPKIVQDHLSNSDALLLIVSENSFESEWVQQEVARAKRVGKPVFPLLLNGHMWPSVEWTQGLDVTNQRSLPEKFYEQLALVTPRGEHPSEDDSIEGEPTAEPFKLRIKSGTLWLLIPIFIGAVGIAFLLWLNGTFRSTSVPAPINTSVIHPFVITALTPTRAVAITPSPSAPTAVANQNWLILVPAGNFIMGSYNGNADEQPVHIVYLDAFYIDKYEVTNALYKSCVDANACPFPKFINSNTRATYYGNSRYDDYPVIGVTWDMAQTYCQWRGGRLLTEAEWEKAARGTDGLVYPWGNGIDPSRANYNSKNGSNTMGDTSAVNAYPSGVSPYGVYDMEGNVWEWVADIYDANYYASLALPITNPFGPTSGLYRVTKGGSWDSTDYDLRSARRNFNDPSKANIYIGFRCGRNP
ncbi:MAG TPA: SUMF1/EgtB/PvdO family nonheme iron enzyme [Anaerolineales bacterium]|nr:SUMF1/EgtB/PvdO family nonheme iron enzyme [Anaerolineales bacterium]